MLNDLSAEEAIALYERAPCAYFATTMDGSLRRVNETLTTWLGLSKRDLASTNLRDLLTAPSQLLYESYYLSRLQVEGGVRDIAIDLLRKDQAPLPVLLSSVVRRGVGGAPDLIVSTMFDITERQRYEREVLTAKRRADTMADVVRHASLAIVTLSFELQLTSWNSAAAQLLTESCAPLKLGMPVRDLFHSEFQEVLIEALERNAVLDRELQVSPHCLCRVQACILSDGLGLFLENVTEQKAQQVALKQAHERFSLVTRATTDGIWDWNVSTDEVYLSANIMGMLGLKPADIITRSSFWTDRIHTRDAERVATEMRRLIEGQKPRIEIDYRVRHESGCWFWVQSRSLSVPDASRIVGSIRDVNKDKVEDPLTGLHTRTSILEDLDRRLGADGAGLNACAVLFLDLDGFKRINDVLGHRSGDLVLQEVGSRLASTIALYPLSSAGRLGGDEFVLILDGALNSDLTMTLANQVHRCFEQPFTAEGRQVKLSASVGIAISSGKQLSAEDLLRNADVAMYRAKAGGKAQTALFSESIQHEVRKRMEMEHDLRIAVQNGELELFFQPKVDLGTKRIVGFEALGRWNHPGFGMVPPDIFIGIAEESSLICDIGLWTLREALRQLSRWRRQGLATPEMTMAINLSPKQFGDVRLIETLVRELEANHLPGSAIELEVTEGVLIGDAEEALRVMEQLENTGVRLALDDFGKGYCSLSYLHRYPFDSLKIDRTFVQSLGVEEHSSVITRTIIALSHALSLEVIAEGIETAKQLALLQEMGCKYGQGYHFYRPLPPQELEGMLNLIHASPYA